ncbi:MAG: RagB/SusD family nutrient uptake outer membrane protein [Bacteroidota bacterium]
MIMKKGFIIIFSLALFLQGCEKILLNVSNTDSPTIETFWETERDAEKGLVAVYNALYQPGLYASNLYYRYDIASDEGFSLSSDTELQKWTLFQYDDYNSESNTSTWGDSYRLIFRANQVLEYVPGIEFQDELIRERIMAQAHFLRGLAHYNLAILWETAPIVATLPSANEMPASSTPDSLFMFIESEFSMAAGKLPVTWDDENIARPTKGAALAMLAKVQMQQHQWSEAKTSLDHFISGDLAGRYELVENYADNFTHLTENNRESVFEIQFSDIYPGGDSALLKPNLGTQRALNFAPPSIGKGAGQARRWLWTSYKRERTVDGDPDPRLRANLFYSTKKLDFPDETQVYGKEWEWGSNIYIRKYQGDYYRNFEDEYAPNNLRLIRYADILLMYAEVINQVEGPDHAAPYVDMVRERAGLEKLDNSRYAGDVQTQNGFQERLETERALELCFETWRWADLKRWGLLDSPSGLLELILHDADFKNFEAGKHHLLPIPLSESENNSNLEQNLPYKN